MTVLWLIITGPFIKISHRLFPYRHPIHVIAKVSFIWTRGPKIKCKGGNSVCVLGTNGSSRKEMKLGSTSSCLKEQRMRIKTMGTCAFIGKIGLWEIPHSQIALILRSWLSTFDNGEKKHVSLISKKQHDTGNFNGRFSTPQAWLYSMTLQEDIRK